MNPAQLNSDLAAGPSRLDPPNPQEPSPKKSKTKIVDDDNDSGADSDSEKPARRSGRRKIKIEYIEDKNRRHITFSKRKAGIMKKAYELSTLTGTQVLLLVVSETGLVYTFTTVKLQPIVTKPEGKNLIQACLNAPDPIQGESSSAGDTPYNTNASPRVDTDKKPMYDDKKVDPQTAPSAAGPSGFGVPPSSAPGYPPQPYTQAGPPGTLPVGNNGYHPGYMNTAAAAAAAAQYQQPPQPSAQGPSQAPQSYGQMPQPPFYGNQQAPPHHYMQHQQPPSGYWPNSSGPGPAPGATSLSRPDQSPIDDKARRGMIKK